MPPFVFVSSAIFSVTVIDSCLLQRPLEALKPVVDIIALKQGLSCLEIFLLTELPVTGTCSFTITEEFLSKSSE